MVEYCSMKVNPGALQHHAAGADLPQCLEQLQGAKCTRCKAGGLTS